MGITKESLSGKMETAIIAVFGAPADAATLKKFCDAVSEAVVQEIIANAIVNSTGVVTSGAGAGGNVNSIGQVTRWDPSLKFTELTSHSPRTWSLLQRVTSM